MRSILWYGSVCGEVGDGGISVPGVASNTVGAMISDRSLTSSMAQGSVGILEGIGVFGLDDKV